MPGSKAGKKNNTTRDRELPKSFAGGGRAVAAMDALLGRCAHSAAPAACWECVWAAFQDLSRRPGVGRGAGVGLCQLRFVFDAKSPFTPLYKQPPSITNSLGCQTPPISTPWPWPDLWVSPWDAFISTPWQNLVVHFEATLLLGVLGVRSVRPPPTTIKIRPPPPINKNDFWNPDPTPSGPVSSRPPPLG